MGLSAIYFYVFDLVLCDSFSKNTLYSRIQRGNIANLQIDTQGMAFIS